MIHAMLRALYGAEHTDRHPHSSTTRDDVHCGTLTLTLTLEPNTETEDGRRKAPGGMPCPGIYKYLTDNLAG